MVDHSANVPSHLVINIRQQADPVSEVTEVDAFASHVKYPEIVVRGPLFGVAEQRRGERPRWRLTADMDSSGCPQVARDSLNSHLWFKAKDETEDPRERRELLDAVTRLERERVDELKVAGTRYRIVRADEFARLGDGRLEPPRPTDVDCEGWDRSARGESRTKGFVLDHASVVGLSEGLDRAALVNLAYASERYPADVLADSRRALRTHPGVVLLPTAFRVMERTRDGWSMVSAALPTPQDARRCLVHRLQEFMPMLEDVDEKEAAVYARAAERFMRRTRPDELVVRGRCFQIVRVERMVRIGPDGPEPPRPSDVNSQEPMQIHPTMDEWGTITYESEGA
ncbi:DUF5954 family protein [Streptomyces sp. NPDC048389]|uniref:DUF5954 family protein n=1 Tax=Streptomyces sp. NPDC048389 TaxID=3154622 RepID=UPI0034566EC5